MYQERFYREKVKAKYIYEVAYYETNLFISSSHSLAKVEIRDIVKKYYQQIAEYINLSPKFQTALSPLELDIQAPLIIQKMLKNSQNTGIGPFACVAGAVADCVGEELLKHTQELIVENGGDVFLRITKDKKIGFYFGDKVKLSEFVMDFFPQKSSFGMASSSAHLGHSLNFGRADLVTVIAETTLIADGFATALSNKIKEEKDIYSVIEFIKQNNSLYGIVIYFKDRLYLWGDKFSLSQ